MNIISTCRMGQGTFEAKFVPLSKLEYINEIYVLRKQKAKNIEKLNYILLPTFCSIKIVSIFITPILLAYFAKKVNAKVILAYHIVPHAFFAFVASRISGIPFIVGQTGLEVQRLSNKFIIGKIILYILKKAKYLNVPGNYSKNHWVKKGIDFKKINLLHSTINTEEFINTNSKKEFDFIFLGRLAAEKNIELIIEAFYLVNKEYASSNMVIVGDGPERSKLEIFVKKFGLGDKIKFVGFQEEVLVWLNKAKVFVMASTSEAMPTALMQAMACELLCVSSNVGNISDLLIHDVNGFLFESNNLVELKELLLNCLLDQNISSKIGAQARKDVIKSYSFDIAISKWNLLLNEL